MATGNISRELYLRICVFASGLVSGRSGALILAVFSPVASYGSVTWSNFVSQDFRGLPWASVGFRGQVGKWATDGFRFDVGRDGLFRLFTEGGFYVHVCTHVCTCPRSGTSQSVSQSQGGRVKGGARLLRIGTDNYMYSVVHVCTHVLTACRSKVPGRGPMTPHHCHWTVALFNGSPFSATPLTPSPFAVVAVVSLVSLVSLWPCKSRT